MKFISPADVMTFNLLCFTLRSRLHGVPLLSRVTLEHFLELVSFSGTYTLPGDQQKKEYRQTTQRKTTA